MAEMKVPAWPIPIHHTKLMMPNAHLDGEERAVELKRIADAAALATKNGIEPHAGHGLTYDNVVPIAAIPQLRELNIGHFLIGEAIFEGLDASVRRMRALMDDAR